MEKLKIGIIGTGFIGGRHIDAINRIPEAQVVAVADMVPSKAQEIAGKLGAAAYTTVEEMLANENLDVVHNCTPNSMHFKVNQAVIQAGKHLYCEKPLALDAKEGEMLLELLAKHPVAHGVNLNYRMNELIQELHGSVKDGKIGRNFGVTGSYLQDWMTKEDDCDWRLDPKSGGASRAIADIGSHLFDISQFVLGKKITAVNARCSVVYPVRKQYEKNGGTFSEERGKFIREVSVVNEDAASIMVYFEDGTQGLFQVSQVCAGHKNDMRLRFDFEDASCEWRQEENNLLYIGHREKPNQIKFREKGAFSQLPAGHPEGWNDVLYQAIREFYKSIIDGSWKQGDVPYATIKDGAWIMKIIEACLKSNACGQWIDVSTGEMLFGSICASL